MKEIEEFSWSDIDRIHRLLAEKIISSGYEVDVIVGIQRCELVPAAHLAYLLKIRELEAIQVISTENDDVLSNRDVDIIVKFAPKVDLRGKNVLLVDAVVDTGTTANICISKLNDCGVSEVRLAAISDWPNSKYSLRFGSARPLIHYVGVKSVIWPDFPWEH